MESFCTRPVFFYYNRNTTNSDNKIIYLHICNNIVGAGSVSGAAVAGMEVHFDIDW